MKLGAITLLLFVMSSVCVEAKAENDSIDVSCSVEQIRVHKLILPVSLIAVGAWGTYNGWMQTLNHSVADNMQILSDGNSASADEYLKYLPLACHIGLGSLGVKSRHSFVERTLVAATSFLAVSALVGGVKYVAKVERPDGSKRNSFPSGHAAVAFLGAELVRLEYGNGYGAGAYAVACGVAFLRLYNNKHWLTDVVAGAGFGILSAHVGYWLLPLNRKLFGFDSHSSYAISAIPTYDYQNRAFGLAFSARF